MWGFGGAVIAGRATEEGTVLQTRVLSIARRGLWAGCAFVLCSCGFDPNVVGQGSFQVVEGRRLMVEFVNGFLDPVLFVSEDGELISPFPIVGAPGLLVQDPGDVVLTADDRAIARAAALAHCAEFGAVLAPVPGVFYPSEGGWGFGGCDAD